MEQLKMYYYELEGSSYEVGYAQGELCKKQEGFCLEKFTFDSQLSLEEETSMFNLFNQYCPGMNEELEGFVASLGIEKRRALYYALTYLRPGCSQMALLPSKTTSGHVLLARNYEFNEKLEDCTLCTTKIKGKYTHIGSTCALFGRPDGMNEWGLGISQSSAGLPVTAMGGPRRPAIVGLQFWAVIRSLLENCKEVEDCLEYIQGMPIAYNINLILADTKGNIALLETLDGRMAYKKINEDSKQQFLHSTNHVHLQELKAYEPKAMRNSIQRDKLIKTVLEQKQKVSKEDLKQLLTTPSPEGLCCSYYEDYFGTLRSMIYDLTSQKLEVCFGTSTYNQWHTFTLNNEIEYGEYLVNIERKSAPKDFFDMI